MAKHTSKKSNGVIHRNERNGIDVLGVDTREIGAAVAGMLLTEIVTVAVQRLSRKTFGLDEAGDKEALQDNANPLQAATAQVGNQVGNVRDAAGETLESMRASANDVSLKLSDIVDVLRDAGERLKAKSSTAINGASPAVLGSVANGATAVLERVIPDTKDASEPSTEKPKKGHKNKKKNKKKKDR